MSPKVLLLAAELDGFLRQQLPAALRLLELSRPETNPAALEANLAQRLPEFVSQARGAPQADWPALFWHWLAASAAIDPVAAPAPATADASRPLADADALAALQAALRSLPWPQRQAFWMRIGEGLSGAEAASRLGLPQPLFNRQLAAAVGALRPRLASRL